jgi:hypothetical protein
MIVAIMQTSLKSQHAQQLTSSRFVQVTVFAEEQVMAIPARVSKDSKDTIAVFIHVLLVMRGSMKRQDTTRPMHPLNVRIEGTAIEQQAFANARPNLKVMHASSLPVQTGYVMEFLALVTENA